MNGLIGRVAIVLGCAVLASLFTWLNAGEAVTVRLGFVTFRSVSLPAVVFGSILFGMGLLFFTGLRADLRTRRMLERYREALGKSSEVPNPEDPTGPH
ncbi:MAG: hypothetical protein M8858_01020 [marine benthic group bacterium]|nr:hypothetical protein [Gemmatimonadota bacterium]